ncbi:hypothetical protein AB6A40_003054 [Gnathostoma spinigerum]|uniref:Uncharacterized protein n=1 Tax=Gnathostoma spinigerum TaxID=75299 RepID=A0ABD6E9K9_9BILA
MHNLLVNHRQPSWLRWVLTTGYILFGVIIGYLLGHLITYEEETDSVLTYAPNLLGSSRNSSISDVTIRCAVVIFGAQRDHSKYVASIRDTYSKHCNDTIFFTDSKLLQAEFEDELNIVYVDTWLTHYNWNFYRTVLGFLRDLDRNSSSLFTNWTIIGDEQMYVVVGNLRKLLFKHDPQQSMIFGRITFKRTFFSLLFPFRTTKSISLRAGIVMSTTALAIMANDKCSGWRVPLATERALPWCADFYDIPIIDSVDKDEMYLFHSLDPKSLITDLSFFPYEKQNFQEDYQKAACCSDMSVTFGSMNYKQQRLIDYMSTAVQVFGRQ